MRLVRFASMVILTAALTACGGPPADNATSTTAVGGGTITPEHVEMSVGGRGELLRLSIATYFGDSCTTVTRPLSATFERDGTAGTITVGSFDIATPEEDRYCAQVAQRIGADVDLSGLGTRALDLTVVVAGNENRLRLVTEPQPRLDLIDAPNVTVVAAERTLRQGLDEATAR